MLCLRAIPNTIQNGLYRDVVVIQEINKVQIAKLNVIIGILKSIKAKSGVLAKTTFKEVIDKSLGNWQ